MKTTSSPTLFLMVATIATTVSTLMLSDVISAAEALSFSCLTPPYGQCGSSVNTTCCPSGQYCQPWNADYFQCINPPAKCSQQFTNIDFYGNSSKAVYGIQPEACCEECAKTVGCTSYTFINSVPGSPACYLKSGSANDRRPLVGAVSGLVNGGSEPTSSPTSAPTPAPTPALPTLGPTPPPTNPCSTPQFGSCGSNATGTTCCPSGQYCQPWNAAFFQCILPPAKCSQQLTNMDFYGNDIKTVFVSQPSLCCDACAQTPGCKAYTYINSNPGQPVCYLKSAAGTPKVLVGAVAGRLN